MYTKSNNTIFAFILLFIALVSLFLVYQPPTEIPSMRYVALFTLSASLIALIYHYIPEYDYTPNAFNERPDNNNQPAINTEDAVQSLALQAAVDNAFKDSWGPKIAYLAIGLSLAVTLGGTIFFGTQVKSVSQHASSAISDIKLASEKIRGAANVEEIQAAAQKALKDIAGEAKKVGTIKSNADNALKSIETKSITAANKLIDAHKLGDKVIQNLNEISQLSETYEETFTHIQKRMNEAKKGDALHPASVLENRIDGLIKTNSLDVNKIASDYVEKQLKGQKSDIEAKWFVDLKEKYDVLNGQTKEQLEKKILEVNALLNANSSWFEEDNWVVPILLGTPPWAIMTILVASFLAALFNLARIFI